MNIRHRFQLSPGIAPAAALSIALTGMLVAARVGSVHYEQVDVAADTPGVAPHTDPALVNGWGIAASNNAVWVADNGTGEVSLLDAQGDVSRFHVFIPMPNGGNELAKPTGLVLNQLNEFLVMGGGIVLPSYMMVATENGTIAAWNPSFHTPKATTVIDRSASGAVYKGLALARDDGESFLYATDFANERIDVFNHAFVPVDRSGAFVDPALPAHYVPFGIQALADDSLVVTYAFKTNPDDDDETAGAGLGIVSRFKANGTFVGRLVSNGELNAPWGVALAPSNFGLQGQALLVGNFGDGWVNAFDLATGASLGHLVTAGRSPIAIEGLWGITFPNQQSNMPDRLYFAAGPGDESHGLTGYIDVVTD